MYILKTLSHIISYEVRVSYIHKYTIYTRVFIAFCNHTETKKVFFLLPFPHIFDFNFSLSWAEDVVNKYLEIYIDDKSANCQNNLPAIRSLQAATFETSNICFINAAILPFIMKLLKQRLPSNSPRLTQYI